VVNGTPKIHWLAGNAGHHLVQMPSITRPRRRRRKRCAIVEPNFSNQLLMGLVRDVEPSLGKEILDVSIAEREA
jgi:hypothetical protein